MLLNYLKLSFRLMARNRFFTFINLTGLGVGFAVFFVLWQYTENELASDTQWKDAERIARMGFIWQWTDDNVNWAQSQFGDWHWPEIPKRLAEDFADIEQMTRIFRQENFTHEHIPFHGKNLFITKMNENGIPISFKESKLSYADPNFFNFFSIPLLAGNPNTALKESNSIVVTQRFAKRYFGDRDPINGTLLINGKIALTVTGVIDDLNANTHFEFEAVISDVGIENYIRKIQSSLGGCHTYFKIKPTASVKRLESALNAKSKFYFTELIPERQKNMVKAEFFLQPLSEVPFSNYRWDYFKPKSKDFLYMLQWVGVLSLVIAWINYIKLSVSSYLKRLREIGVRKTNGAGFRDFVIQFATESVITNLLSILLAFTIVQLVKSPIEILFGFYVLPWKALPLSGFMISIMAFIIGILITCMVPLLLYSGYSSVSLFRAIVKKSGGMRWSNGLVVVQFCFSIVLIVMVFVVYAQVDYVLNANYGLNRDEVAVIDLPLVRGETFESDLAVVMEKIKATPGVRGVTAFATITGDAENNMVCIKRSEANNDACLDTSGGVNEDFLHFFGIHLLAGRNFQQDLPADSSTIILSRKAITRIGFNSPEEAVGSRILVNTGTYELASFRYAEIIGVIEDYKIKNQSFLIDQATIEQGIILTYKDRFVPSSKFQKIAVSLSGHQFEVTGKKIKDIYNQIFPDQPFRFYFLDEQIARFYDGEKTARNQILLFSLIAIGITCLGLLGMISNKVLEKIKEIGIRKVLGARLDQIAQLLLIPTAWQILIAMAVGIPVSLYLVQQYLQKFSEHIQLHWWHFALPVMILLTIMFATIASVLWKAANNNPVEALKYE